MKNFKELGLKAFENNNFDEAIFGFTKEFEKTPNDEITFLLDLSYFAKKSPDNAQYKFENFYQKSKDYKKLITLFDSKELGDFADEVIKVNGLNIISFKDLKILIKNNNFREVFEKIHFNTKISFENREDFFDFMVILFKNGYEQMAFETFENSLKVFLGDARLKQIGEKIYENRNKR